jgi:iron complex outermembrane recepter protein
MSNRSLRSLAAVLAASALIPTGAWSQNPTANTPAASQTPAVNQPEATPPAPAPAPTPQAEPTPADKPSVPIPAVTVTAPPRRAVAPQPAQRAAIAPRPIVAAPRPAVAPPAILPAASTSGPPAPGALPKPPGQTITSISGETIKNAPAFSIQDLLQESPGISIKQGNGPRDVGISIRGSNARNGFGIRNIVVLEDGFPVTQPDGLSRTDLTDPHAYGGVDVYRGPSSAMFGNYATGGAINFRLWRGGQINGAIYGVEGGSFGYLNNYALIGKQTGNFEGSLFASDVRGNGYISHSSFNTQTLNSLMTYAPTPNDRVTLR